MTPVIHRSEMHIHEKDVFNFMKTVYCKKNIHLNAEKKSSNQVKHVYNHVLRKFEEKKINQA